MRTITRDIVGALIFSSDGQLLLGKNKVGGVYEDKWVIPGGGVDDGESKEQAVQREILEEVGINITHARSISQLPHVRTGTTEKTLRDTGERVLVNMTFYDYRVDLDAPAKDISLTLEDDFGYAEWVPLGELNGRHFSPPLEEELRFLGLI